MIPVSLRCSPIAVYSDHQESRPFSSERSTQDAQDEAAPSASREAPLTPTKETYDTISLASDLDLERGPLDDESEQRQPRSTLGCLATATTNSLLYLVFLAILRFMAYIPFIAISGILDHGASLTGISRAIYEAASLLTWILFTYLSCKTPEWIMQEGKLSFREAMREALVMLYLLWAAINFVTIVVCSLIAYLE